MTMNNERLQELRKIAEAAIGQYHFHNMHCVEYSNFIYAFNPETAKALLDEIERLRGDYCEWCKKWEVTYMDNGSCVTKRCEGVK